MAMALQLFAPFEASFRVCGYKHGVPPWLMKGMGHETSHFRADAHGPTNDWGVMQVIESNAPGCGLTVADLTDPGSNICCAAWLMGRNIRRVKELGATGSDALLLALARNNLGGGNVDSKIAALADPTWEAFKAATPQWPGKHAWVEKMWGTAKGYRLGEWGVNLVALMALGWGIYLIAR